MLKRERSERFYFLVSAYVQYVRYDDRLTTSVPVSAWFIHSLRSSSLSRSATTTCNQSSMKIISIVVALQDSIACVVGY